MAYGLQGAAILGGIGRGLPRGISAGLNAYNQAQNRKLRERGQDLDYMRQVSGGGASMLGGGGGADVPPAEGTPAAGMEPAEQRHQERLGMIGVAGAREQYADVQGDFRKTVETQANAYMRTLNKARTTARKIAEIRQNKEAAIQRMASQGMDEFAIRSDKTIQNLENQEQEALQDLNSVRNALTSYGKALKSLLPGLDLTGGVQPEGVQRRVREQTSQPQSVYGMQERMGADPTFLAPSNRTPDLF